MAEIADLLRPEDVAAILLMLQSAQQQVLLAQADSSISAQLSSLQVLARVSESNGDITVKRAGQTFTLKVGDSILAGDEVNSDTKPVTLQLATRSSDAGPTVKFSGVVQLGFENPNPVASTKFLLAVIQGPAAVLGASQAHQSVVLSTPAGLFTSAGAGAGFGVNVSAGGSTTLVANGGKQDVSFVFFPLCDADMAGRSTEL